MITQTPSWNEVENHHEVDDIILQVLNSLYRKSSGLNLFFGLAHMHDHTNVHVYVIIFRVWASGRLEVFWGSRNYTKMPSVMVRYVVGGVDDILIQVFEPD